MKPAFRVMIICAYLLSLITSIFGDFAFLTAFSFPERPALGSWNLLNPRSSTSQPHLGPQIPTTIVSGVGPTLTLAKARRVRRPPRPVPPLLRSSLIYQCHHLILPVTICTHCLRWPLWHHETRPGRQLRHFGILKTQLERKVSIIPVLLKIVGLSRVSELRYKHSTIVIIGFFRLVVRPPSRPCQAVALHSIE